METVKHELIEFVSSLTEEQVDEIVKQLPSICEELGIYLPVGNDTDRKDVN